MAVGRILVVDDEQAIRELVRQNLELSGYECIDAEDGSQALQKVGEQRPDLIVLDVKMPVLDGWEVLRVLRSSPETATIPIVMLTALGDSAHVARGWTLGADFYLTKPFEPRELVAVVTRLLKGECAAGTQ